MKLGAPTRADLLALEEKYAQLEGLRRARARGEPVPERAVFKALADRFPGALRELDMLPMEVIELRRQQVQRAVAGGVIEPWMAWMSAYHTLLRVALWIKLRTAKAPDVTPERMVFLVRTVESEFGFGVDESFVLDAARPSAGRLNAMVLGRLEAMFGVPVADIKKALYVRRS